MAAASAAPAGDSASLQEQGRLAFSGEQYERAEAFFKAALQAGADPVDCHRHLARIYNLQQDWKQALEHWQWLQERQPEALEPRLQVARGLFRFGRFPEAALEYGRVLELERDHAEALKRLAYIEGLTTERLASDISDAGPAPPQPAAPADAPAALAQAIVDRGKAAFQAQQLEAGRVAFQEALTAGADEAMCHLYLARIHNLEGDREAALAHWQWLAQRTPDAVEPSLQVGRALFRLKRHGEARAALEAVTALQPEHAEALDLLARLEARAGSVPPAQPTLPDNPAPQAPANDADEDAAIVRALVGQAREAFQRQDYAHAEALFQQAMRQGAEEGLCRLHLARIYNQLNDWPLALEQWQWLQRRDPREVEPKLQVARALHRLGRLAQAAESFRSVLELDEGHAEAIERLQQIEAAQDEEAQDGAARESWLSRAPEGQRWGLAADLLGGEIGSLEMLLFQAGSHAEALTGAVKAVAEAEGPLGSQRELYGLQTARAIAELAVDLKDAGARVRDLLRRTEKLFATFERATGTPVTPLRTARDSPSRAAVREKVEQLVASARADRGVDVGLAVLYREAPVAERATLLASQGIALRDTDRANALRMFWLAYGAEATPTAARRAAIRLFTAGDLSGAAALLEGLPSLPPAAGKAAFGRAVESTVALFRKGISIPPRAERRGAATPGTLGYVASGSLPFQIAGYTVRTQALLDSLPAAGVRPVCFTQPGFPWDRPNLLAPGAQVPPESVVGTVRYHHTPWPEGTDPVVSIDTAADVLAALFRKNAIETVQAASNGRNALPALMAARTVGARFVYEVRGLWELTAAARFAGWETTERYRFDRELEIRIATEADHVLAITGGVADELVAGGVPRDHISLLPNAVDPELFAPLPRDAALAARLGLRDDDFVVVYAGSLSSYEGLDDLIEAGALVIREGIPFRLVLAGDGEFRARLEAVAAATGQVANVIFTGRLPPDNIRSHLSLADAVAIPRKPYRVCQVVSPLKPFEAMSMEKAVILSDLPVLREIVRDGETGLFCKPADARDLADRLIQLARDRALRERLGRAAREWIRAERSWARNARTLSDLYADLNGRPRGM